jgi:hypothetical protein
MASLRFLFVIMLSIASTGLGLAQNVNPVKTVDRVYLKNGSVFQGKILEYAYGKELKLELTNGDVITFTGEEIERVKQEVQTAETALPVNEESLNVEEGYTEKGKRKERPYQFKETGIYNVTYFANLNGRDDDGVLIGFGAHHVLGYQFNRWVGLGLGLGIDTYSFGDGETLYPVYAEVRGYLLKKRLSPYYSFGAGYGFAFANESEGITEATGGYMLHPAVGYRLGASEGANVVIDLGYRFQQAEFISVSDFNDSKQVREQLYKRLTLRLGLIF